jgi:apolipoprotein N-acyltransferase
MQSTTFDENVSARRSRRPSPSVMLAVGAVFVFMTFMRYSLAEIAWVTFAPFLMFVQQPGTRRRYLALFGTLALAFLAAISKMATHEIPWAPPVPMFAIPLAFSYFLAVALAGAAHRKLGTRWGIYTFASMAVVMSWVQYTLTPGSSWGALAHTQVDNLPFVQLAAVTGIGGMTFLVAMGSGLVAAAWSSGVRFLRVDFALFAALLGASLLYGQLRLSNPAPGASVWVGAVVSPVTHQEFHAAAGGGVDVVRSLDDELFRRTARAVDRGASVVVWNEMATLVTVDGESALAARGQAFAKERGIMLVMAYGVFDSLAPLHDTNKYRVYLPDGTMADEYVKRHPVPGDPDAVGRAHAKTVSFGGANFSGGICYDYGFPEISLDNARDGADVALVPSSDWRGIDPLHGRMALVNAVAVGLPMVRPVRAATSIMSDQYGRLLGSMRADGETDGVLVANVSAARAPTLFFRTGEWVPFAAMALCLLVIVKLLRGHFAAA